jgi:MFS family permease
MINTDKPRISEVLRSYPTALKESFAVWKKVPRSMFYLFASNAIMMFGIAAVQLYLVVYAVEELFISEAVWPLILTALPITMILLSIPMGKIVDKTNRKGPILIAYMLFGVSLLLFLYGDVVKLFISLMLLGVGVVTMNSAFGALQADLTPKEQRGKVNGFTSFANNILMATGSLVGGVLYDRISPQLPFFVALLFIIPAFLLLMAKVYEPKRREE